MAREVEPASFIDVASALAGAAAAGEAVRIVGSGTKQGWCTETAQPDVILHSKGLNQLVEHNEGDLTAVLEAGAPLAQAQETFAKAGQMLALDPPLGSPPLLARASPTPSAAATIGGVLATADSGPMRHRYGAPRDLVLGMTVALSDGTIAKSGGKVIKNVAGYDIAKLFCGAFGTLGVILQVSVRLHPAPVALSSVVGASTDPDVLSAAAQALAAAPLELEALDVAWRGGRGGIIARVGGVEAARRAERVASLMSSSGLEQVDVAEDDNELWARQRAGQRSAEAALMRVAARPSALGAVLRAAEAAGGTVVGRAALGSSFIEVEPSALATLRGGLPAGVVSLLLDAPPDLRRDLDHWGVQEGPALELMRRVKARFDPAHACNPGVFVGGI